MQNPLPPLSALRAFEAAARNGSLSAAARELNVTHPAIAQQVKKLEEWFGVPLLQRAGRGVAVTAEGPVLARELGDGFETLRRAVESMDAAATTRPLGITLTPSFAASWLMPRYAGFREAHPDIEVLFNPSAVVVEIGTGDIDLGIRFGSGEWPGLESERLLNARFVVVAAPSFMEGREYRGPQDLPKMPLIQELGTDEWRFWLLSHGIDMTETPIIMHLPGLLTIDAIRNGLGVGISNTSWVAEDIESGRLVALFEEPDTDKSAYFLVTRPGVPRPPLKAFISWIKAEAEADQRSISEKS